MFLHTKIVPNKMIFKYCNYIDFLKRLKELAPVNLFRDLQKENVFLLRHDVDLDISLALIMAKFEKELNICATYFFLVTAPTYNILSEDNKRMLNEIKNMGHEIGLHFDPTLYETDLDAAVKKEADILSFIINEDIKSISLHNPSVHGQYPLFEGFVNAYDPALFSDDNYMSDSCFSFRGKDPFEFIEKVENNMIQICLHPELYSKTGYNYKVLICNHFLRYINETHNRLLINKTYNKQVGLAIMPVFKDFIAD